MSHEHNWHPVATSQDYDLVIIKCDACGETGFKWLSRVFYE